MLALSWVQENRFLIAALLCIAAPAIFNGPLLPLTDTVAFAALNSYPGNESFGPYHYYVFEYTYILPHVLSRAMRDLSIGVPTQVLLYYLAQAATFVVALDRLLDLLALPSSVRNWAVLLGSLAFWDALFLWGGPLAYSLAAALWIVSVVISAQDAARGASRPWLFAAISMVACASHPFAFVFVLPLAVLRLWWIPARRAAGGAALGLLLLYAVLILTDNPEPAASGGLTRLFGLHLSMMWSNVKDIFSFDARTIPAVFQVSPELLLWLLRAYACVRVVGFVSTPWLLYRHRADPAVALVLSLNLMIATMYLFSDGADVISIWPQRVLTFSEVLTFGVGVYAIWSLSRRLPLDLAGRVPGVAALSARLSPRVLLAATICACLIASQWPILSQGKNLSRQYAQARARLLASHVSNAYMRIRSKNLNAVQPFYLRAVPFLLFSDPEVLARHILIQTEWHSQPRHNSRLPEMAELPKRPLRNLYFDMVGDKVSASVHEFLPQSTVEFHLSFAGLPATMPGAPVLTTGVAGDGNFVYALSPSLGVLVLGVSIWGKANYSSPPLSINPAQVYDLRITYEPLGMALELNGVRVLTVDDTLGNLEPVQLGQNSIGGTSAGRTYPTPLHGTLGPVDP